MDLTVIGDLQYLRGFMNAGIRVGPLGLGRRRQKTAAGGQL